MRTLDKYRYPLAIICAIVGTLNIADRINAAACGAAVAVAIISCGLIYAVDHPRSKENIAAFEAKDFHLD